MRGPSKNHVSRRAAKGMRNALAAALRRYAVLPATLSGEGCKPPTFLDHFAVAHAAGLDSLAQGTDALQDCLVRELCLGRGNGRQHGGGIAASRNGDVLAFRHPVEQGREVGFGFVGADGLHDRSLISLSAG